MANSGVGAYDPQKAEAGKPSGQGSDPIFPAERAAARDLLAFHANRLSVGPEMKRVLSAGYRRPRESEGPEPAPLLSPGAGPGLNRGQPLRFWSSWIPA